MSNQHNRQSETWPTYKAVIRGRVTGVGFRFSAIREAQRYNHIFGRIRNVDDRTVECVVQGPEDEVREFLRWLRQGPEAARVESCDISPIEGNPQLPPFTIGY
jgi:acylphosphatase